MKCVNRQIRLDLEFKIHRMVSDKVYLDGLGNHELWHPEMLAVLDLQEENYVKSVSQKIRFVFPRLSDDSSKGIKKNLLKKQQWNSTWRRKFANTGIDCLKNNLGLTQHWPGK